ncbi:MAG: HAD family hydrolase [Gaiellaceae bacterium]
MISAACFDLDRTFIRRSSALALAGAFREHGIISRRQVIKAGLWQLLFAARGANPQAVRDGIANGVALLCGVSAAEVERLAADAVDTVLRPLVYDGALALADEHRARGDSVYLVTASLQEIVEPFAAALGFEGALGTVGELDDEGRYTGRVVRACHGEAKAESLRLIEGIDLAGSTAYTDGIADLALLEAVGNPVAVNPDRALRRVAAERGWPVLDFRPGPIRLALRAVG